MGKDTILERAKRDAAKRDVRQYNSVQEGLQDNENEIELTFTVTCGAANKVARVFGSHDKTVLSENTANSIGVVFTNRDHEYVRSFLGSKAIAVHEVQLSASNAAQVTQSWTFVRTDIAGNELKSTIAFRTNSTQMQQDKLEQKIRMHIDGESELRIPMLAGQSLTVTLKAKQTIA